MRWNDIYISSCAVELGRKEDTEVAVAEGRYGAREAAANGYLSTRVVDDLPAVELAVRAAKLALSRGEAGVADIDLVVHSSCGHQGLDHFAPASYVQSRALGGGTAAALEVKQASSGGLAGLEMAAAYLNVCSDNAAALLTASDVFRLPRFDRYRSDDGVVYADGGTGLVLSRAGGVARLLSTCLLSDGEFGAFHAGEVLGGELGEPADGPLDVSTRRQEQYLVENGELLMKLVDSIAVQQLASIAGALAHAGMGLKDITRWVFTNVGETMVDPQFRADMGISDAMTTWEWGRRTGHLGAADQIAGLTYLLESGEVRRGDHVALCGIGMGFTYACAVVEILDEPDWSLSAA
ncbi:ketoacyl-ACP synthase III family protein [Streptomyces olivaceus]|uniref:Ketoacyl-ACP synthase III family protein n=1 Tax=Streptomyces olivaceus TaxID=47716 RepID=A0ABS7WFM0_STROV|nr:ketoacyl-ACP synthase III family protein [Streptomyces olivaceus]MBZ6093500.1 ketoacyl-ACP synthase III family protein [Streptomyces olivaceus]MBZ6100433.1 ketoacyl-ACP synthase III family protein [Streptomyces olivaceus]MBZ6121597.1 ketoacyl-ACP synthase III family protein [Streptomyces olivaceus]MBZ6156333.1 ketoacyl-ACP synthase III family protein [Streptomyces olivaceus]MBZ6302859.1 ketoacyl-ACP synthase III family protein [Streptomyces olivaceus]